MKKLFTTAFTTLALLFTTSTVVNAQSDGARVLTGSAQPPLPFNVLPQPGFENRTTGWFVTSGTFTTTQATANVARGQYSASWTVPTSTSSGLFLQSDLIALPAGLYGRQCVAAVLSKGNALTNGAMVLEAYDGTTAYGTIALANSTNYIKTFSAGFTCPTSGSLRLRIRTTATTSASPTPVYFDEMYLGDSDSFGNGGIFYVTPTTSIVNDTTVSFGSAPRQLMYVQGSGGPVTLNAVTALTAGTTNGQEFFLVGRSDVNTVTIPNSGNVVLKSSTIVLGNNDVIGFEWDEVNSVWVEESSTEIDASQIVAGILPVTRGGTGLSSGTSGGIPYFSGTATIASSGLLAANQLVLGGGAGTTPATLGSLGTTTTLLHGNAAGVPSFSALVAGDISSNLISNAKLAQMAAHTFKGNNTGSTADPLDLTATELTAELNLFTSVLKGLVPLSGGGVTNFLRADGSWSVPSTTPLQAPTIQVFTSGSGNYTTPANVIYIEVEIVGGGGGGAGSGTSAGTAATAGGNTTFGTTLLTANGGSGGALAGNGGNGGSATTAGASTKIYAVAGGAGGPGVNQGATTNQYSGGVGGTSCLGGAGSGGASGNTGGGGATNSGSGGGGGGNSATSGMASGSGGGSGGCVKATIAPTSGQVFAYSVGAAGSAGGAGAGSGAQSGGGGSAGYVVVKEFY